MKAWALGLTFICIDTSSFAATSEAFSIRYDELQTVIQKNNGAVLAAGEDTQAARQITGTIEQSFLPKAGFETGLAEQKEANGVGDTAPFWKVDVQANVYRGGRDRLALLLRDSQILIREMDAQALLRSELFKARTDYVRLAIIRQTQALVKASMDDYDSLRQSIGRKAQAGLMTSTAAQNTLLEVDELKRELIILESEEHELKDKLSLVLGIKEDQEIKLETSFLASAIKQKSHFKGEQADELPEIQRLTLLSKSSQLEATARNEWWRPDVNVFASYTGYDVKRSDEFASLPERDFSVGVRLSIDLESKAAYDKELSVKRIEQSALAYRTDHLRREIKHKVHEYGREMDLHESLIKTYDSSVVKSEKLLKTLRGEFERGLIGSEDVASTIRSLFAIKKRKLESLNSFYLAKAGLETVIDTHDND